MTLIRLTLLEPAISAGSNGPLRLVKGFSMGANRQNFLRTLAYKFSSKNNEVYTSVISWLRIQLSFAISMCERFENLV